jgi:hypothetical protein
MSSYSATLQITTYPPDFPVVEHALPHQLRMWGTQVNKTNVILDVHRSQSGRYRGMQYDENLAKIRELLQYVASHYHNVNVCEVNYSELARKNVSTSFFGLNKIPVKAWDGSAFYSYFYGLHVANSDYVLHMDGDMLFGGGSQTWLSEAVEFLKTHPDVLFAGPLPGPPHPTGSVYGHNDFCIMRESDGFTAYRFPDVSTRIFLVDLRRMRREIGTLPLLPPILIERLQSRILGNPPARGAEEVLSIAMASHKLSRVDFLGSGSGMWSLHPPFRSENFIRALPALVRRVEQGDVPEDQLGNYEINDSMFDWSEARASQTWTRRKWRDAKHVASRFGLLPSD